MLRLRNIVKKNSIIEADYYPEDGELFGHIVIGVINEEIISVEEVRGFGSSYAAQARYRLADIAKQNTDITECIVMWC